eukprot:8673588-Prorocentrum_lima.AAC.1
MDGHGVSLFVWGLGVGSDLADGALPHFANQVSHPLDSGVVCQRDCRRCLTESSVMDKYTNK